MEWINLHTSVLDSPEFIGADPVDRATWLCLMRYCAGQENGGVIGDAKAWSDRRWQQLARVTLREVKRTCPLWRWDADSLRVAFYNPDKEEEVRRLRSQASNAARARWNARTMPSGMPDGIPDPMPKSTDAGTAEGKGREEKGKEGKIPPTPKGDASGSKSRKAKPASVHPSEHAEPIQSRMYAIGDLLRRLRSTRWSADDAEAFKAAGLGALSEADFAEQIDPLRRYYLAVIPREKDFRRRDVLRLLRNWAGEIDKARSWVRENNDGVTKV